MHKSHRQYELEINQLQEKVGLWRVRDKYFSQKQPNFLTWAEKEHLRYLHEKDPTEWTPERLCESFPVDLVTAKKLLKAKWIPKNYQRVKKHDEAVAQNWEQFKSGAMTDLNQKLQQHLTKFANRQIDASALPKFQPKAKLIDNIKTKNNEFLNIITSCKKYQLDQPQTEEVKQFEVKPTDEHEGFQEQLIGIPENDSRLNRRMTLDELKRILEQPDERQESEPDNYREPNNPGGTELLSFQSTEEIISMDRFKSEGPARMTDRELQKMYVEPIKEYIRIPRQLWRRGATYKLGDCYYDDDGEFLYRVPGMTKVG